MSDGYFRQWVRNGYEKTILKKHRILYFYLYIDTIYCGVWGLVILRNRVMQECIRGFKSLSLRQRERKLNIV